MSRQLGIWLAWDWDQVPSDVIDHPLTKGAKGPIFTEREGKKYAIGKLCGKTVLYRLIEENEKYTQLDTEHPIYV